MRQILLLLASMPLALCLLAGQVRAAEDTDDDEAAIHESVRKHLPKAKLTLVDAITRALKEHPGGHAVEAGFDVEDSDYDFVVEIASGDKHFDVEIDALTGKLESDKEISEAEAGEQDVAQAVTKSKITLSKAIGTAIHALGGKGVHAFDAGAHLDEGKLIFEVGLLSGQDIYDVQVDGTTGKVLAQKKAD